MTGRSQSITSQVMVEACPLAVGQAVPPAESQAKGLHHPQVSPSARLSTSTKDPAADVTPAWSPDGRQIYFCSGRSGTRQLWRMPAGGGQAEQITRFGGCFPIPSPDGKTLYYMKQTGAPVSSLWKVPAEGGEELLVVNNVLDRCFALFKNKLYYAARRSAEQFPSLYSLDLSSNQKVLIRSLHEPLFYGFAISPDGAAMLCREMDRRECNLMLVNDLH